MSNDGLDNLMRQVLKRKEKLKTTDELVGELMAPVIKFFSNIPHMPKGPYVVSDDSYARIDDEKSIYDFWIEIICKLPRVEYHSYVLLDSERHSIEACLYRDLGQGDVEFLNPAVSEWEKHYGVCYIREHELENDTYWKVLSQYADFKNVCPYCVKGYAIMEIMDNNKEIIALYETLGEKLVDLYLLPDESGTEIEDIEFVLVPPDDCLQGSIISWKESKYVLESITPGEEVVMVTKVADFPTTGRILDFFEFFMQQKREDHEGAYFAIPLSDETLAYVVEPEFDGDDFVELFYRDKTHEITSVEFDRLYSIKKKILGVDIGQIDDKQDEIFFKELGELDEEDE